MLKTFSPQYSVLLRALVTETKAEPSQKPVVSNNQSTFTVVVEYIEVLTELSADTEEEEESEEE